jgi:hypothetical protein
MTKNTRSDLLDTDGENRAVRTFLLAYGGNTGLTIGNMRRHMEMSGWEEVPKWVETVHPDSHMTKADAQSWIRFLFSLETKENTALEYFKDEHDKLLFILLELKDKARLDFLGVSSIHYIDRNAANEWKNKILAKIDMNHSKSEEAVQVVNKLCAQMLGETYTKQ